MFRLRDYTPDDAAATLNLFKDTIRRVNRRDYVAEQIAAWAPDEIPVDAWNRKLLSRRTLVAVTNDDTATLAGFSDLEPNGHLDRFFVSADFQRRGVGRMLLSAMIAQGREWKLDHLFTEASITARPFFLAHGFRELRNNLVVVRGIALLNYLLERPLP